MMAPPCANIHCGRRATYFADGYGPVCEICMTTWINEGQVETLFAFHPYLAQRISAEACLVVMEYVLGDGRERDCICGRCKPRWCDRGWMCPVWYVQSRYGIFCFCGRCQRPWFYDGWLCPNRRWAWRHVQGMPAPPILAPLGPM